MNCPPAGFSGDFFAFATGFHAVPSQNSTSYFVGGLHAAAVVVDRQLDPARTSFSSPKSISSQSVSLGDS